MSSPAQHRIEIDLKPGVTDSRGNHAAGAIRTHLGLNVTSVRSRDVITLAADLTPDELDRVRREFTDPVIQVSALNRLEPAEPFDWMLLIGFKPGVTDNVGRTAGSAIGDILGRGLAAGESVHTATAYFLRGELSCHDALRIGRDLLANELIETVEAYDPAEWRSGKPEVHAPRAGGESAPEVRRIALDGGDAELMRISKEGTLALTLEEMRAIREHFAQAAGTETRKAASLGAEPTDVELETLAQTWSEHCKHKIFAGRIHYTDTTTGETRVIDSLFKTYIRAATEEIGKRVPWLVSVFHDNAGVIDFNERIDIVFKAETHNSPSALEPYGGAMTGIVGCNRDPLGTGMGAELLFNIWGYCFASPFTPAEKIPEGAMHPRRLRDGVHKGVIDGGNQSGIPYGVGWEFYDERFLAKPLVYCGTVGWLPKRLPDGRKAAEKEARPGDLVVLAGGRTGKDGIHGATFSSEELHKDSPVQAVQIGDPITQKKLADWLIEARDLGLYSAVTDNGAGGLSSSIGEMAGGPGGARIDLAAVPLKYPGLQPWEIWLSEAQERMTLAVPPEKIEALKALAVRRDVEISVLGEFNANGYLTLEYAGATAGLISMEFLHNGCPRLVMPARWTPPTWAEPTLASTTEELAADWTAMLGRLNIASIEEKSRQYDHEVKGRSVVKPFIGVGRDVPSDATVFLAEHGGKEGVVLSRGINPHLSDVDTYWMIASVMDEAIRRILAVGGRLDFIAGLDNFCWPDPVEAPGNPDGAYKLAQLVRANEALYDFCTAFDVPLISGKDSMKNDSTRGGRKISIPPAVLFSAVGKIDDVGRALTLEAKAAGDLVYVIGETRRELGGSEYARMRAEGAGRAEAIGTGVPKLDAAEALRVYRGVERVTRAGAARSLHAVGLGGLAVGLSMVALGGGLGLEIDLAKVPQGGDAKGGLLSEAELLFSQSNGRFIATVAPERADEFEAALAGVAFRRVGKVAAGKMISVENTDGSGSKKTITINCDALRVAWKQPFQE